MASPTDAKLRSPEAAKRLGISGRDVYRLIFAGELDGRPDADGIVFINEASVDAYLERHGFGNVAGSSTGSAGTSSDEDTRRATPDARKRSAETPNDTDGNGPTPRSSGS